MQATFLGPVLALLAVAAAQPETPGAQVTLPLSEYEGLKRSLEKASVTVVDTLRLEGSFKGRDLALTFKGRSAGTMPAEAVLAGGAGVVLYGCEGDGIVSRREDGHFQVTPLAARFAVRCRIAMRGSDRLELTATRAVLWVEAAVADGELVLAGDADGSRSFSVVRRTTVAAEGLTPSATARYRLTLRPDETRFRYEIQVHNPNRSRQAFDLTLASGEHVQQVDAATSYDVQGTRYRFELAPGETGLVLTGTLSGSSFTPPLEAALQYALLESHPLLRPLVRGEPKRVSPQEVGIAAEYRGAQAFLLAGREGLAWDVTRLEALRTTSYAVTNVGHVLFLPVDGPALGESVFALDNQGSPDVSLPMAAEPTFASLAAEPVLLTKDAKGNLWLPIAQGQQELLVQHRQPFRRFAGFARAALALPQLPVAASTAGVELRYPSEWFPLYEAFQSEARFAWPGAGAVIGWLFFFLATERALSALGLARGTRLTASAAAALAALSWGWAAAVVSIADLAVAVVVAIPWLRRHKVGPVTVGLVLVAGAFLLLMVAVAIPSLLRARIASPGYDSRRLPASAAEGTVADAEARAGKAGETYQGLPARFTLPAGGRRTHFSREMLGAGASEAVRVVLVSSTVLGLLQTLLILAAAWLVWRVRREIAAGWQRRLEATRAKEEPVPAAG